MQRFTQLHLSENTLVSFAKVAATHCQSIKLSLITNTYNCNNIINGYTRCQELENALKLFDEMPCRDVASWNTIITGYANSGNFLRAWEVLKSMKRHSFLLDGYTFVSMLKCIVTTNCALAQGQQVHTDVVKMGFHENMFASRALLSMYGRWNNVDDANEVLKCMPLQNRDTSCWNIVISGYVKLGKFLASWEVAKSLKRLGFMFDGYTFGSLLKGTADCGGIIYGLQIHTDVVKMGFCDNVYAASALLDMYAKLSNLDDADKVFKYMSERNTVSWNALIAAYAEISHFPRCFGLFISMENEGVRIDDGTLAPLLTLLEDVESYELLRQLHGKIMKRGLEYENTVVNSMITAYSECGSMEDSKRLFCFADGYRDLVTWNSMLAAFLGNNMVESGFTLFLEMVERRLELDTYSYTSIISVCGEDLQQSQGISLHGLVIKMGLEHLTAVSNALISMYLKSNSNSEDAVKVFNGLLLKDHVSWNSILTGMSQKGLSENAQKLFHQMQLNYLIIDQYAFAAVLRSCADLATLKLGRQIHVLVLKYGLEHNEYVASALIFTYSKCGIIEDSLKSFDDSRKESSVTWNSIIFSYAQHGQGKKSLDLFHLMSDYQVKMDHITFVAVVTACSHIGLVEEGIEFLKSMEKRYGIVPQMENYACAVDLLGRSGRLMEAKKLIEEMPFEPDLMVWKTMLGACRACGDIDLATQVGNRLLELDPREHCTYVLLADVFGHLKRWDEKASVKRLMRKNGVKKIPGWSWMELQDDIHAFNADDHSHQNCREIYQRLDELMNEVRISEDASTFDVSLDELVLNGCY